MIVMLPIPASCRARCRAVFRRVAGGALPERGRGVEEINHGRTRTGFVNARPELEMRKRKRRASVLVCGSRISIVKGTK